MVLAIPYPGMLLASTDNKRDCNFNSSQQDGRLHDWARSRLRYDLAARVTDTHVALFLSSTLNLIVA